MALPAMLAEATPVFAAPMAGGPSAAELVVNVSRAGHFAQLAAGYKTVEAMADEIAQVRARGAELFGVNLFVPSPVPISRADYQAYSERLASIAAQLGQRLPPPREDDDHWEEKVAAVVADPVPVVSFTFGLPDVGVVRRLRAAGTFTLQTVTSAAEARAAQEAGVDGVTVQGFAAGGHSGIWNGSLRPLDVSLSELVREVRSVTALPLFAAGGVSRVEQVRDLLSTGADAVVVGTALLLADEAGTSPVHRAVLSDARFDRTVLTRAFTGRYARALANDFTREFSNVAPSGYPALHHLTRGIRSAASAAGDSGLAHLWAGEGWRDTKPGPVAEVLGRLAP